MTGLFDSEFGFPAAEKFREEFLERLVDVLQTVVEARVDGLFELGNNIFERCGGLFEVDKLFCEELIALLGLLKFPDDGIAVAYSRLFYLYFQTLKLAPPLFLGTTVFRKRALRYLGFLPAVDCGADERNALAHLFLETLPQARDVGAGGRDGIQFRLRLPHTALEADQVAFEGKARLACMSDMFAQIFELRGKRRFFFLHTLQGCRERTHLLAHLFVRLRSDAGQAFDERLNATAHFNDDGAHAGDVVATFGIRKYGLDVARELPHMRHGNDLFDGHVGSLQGTFGAAALPAEPLAFAPRPPHPR